MKRRRTPRTVGKSKVRKNRENIQEVSIIINEKTLKEKIYDIIYDASRNGYHFVDKETGSEFIDIDDLEEKGNGIYVLRFRCPPEYMHHVYFGRMAEEVCEKLHSEIRFIHEKKQEYGIPFEECVWVIQVGEKHQEFEIWRKIFMEQTVIKDLEKSTRNAPKKCSHERWEEFLQTHYSRSLVSVAKALGYSEQNIDILECEKNDPLAKKTIYNKYKKLFDSFLKDEWNKALVDGRNVLDYFKDLIASWVGEDLLVKALNEYGFMASLANADSDRVIKTQRARVTGEPDIKIEFEGNTRYLELMDALSPVECYGQFDLRLSKAKNQYAKKTLFLLHGLADGKYILIDFMRDNITVKYNFPNPRFGNKPCSVVNLEENGIKMHPMSLFWESLKDIMLNTKPEPDGHYLKLVDYNSGEEEVLCAKVDQEELLVEDESSSDDDSSVITVDEEPEISEQEEEKEQEVQIEEEVKEEEVQTELEREEAVEEDNEEQITYTAEQWEALNDIF